jgi:hypothetical protein
MKVKQMIFLITVIVIAGAFGCSKKEAPVPATVEQAVQQSVEMPELEQNKLYQNSQPEWARNPDTSFTNGPDNLGQPSEEDLLFDEPAGD